MIPSSPEFIYKRSRPASPDLMQQTPVVDLDTPYEPLFGLGTQLLRSAPVLLPQFPGAIIDRQASDRLEHLLGRRTLKGLRTFRVNELSANYWLYNWLLPLVPQESIERLALTGGAASFALGQGLLRWGLDSLRLPPELHQRLKTQISKQSHEPSDVDFELVLGCEDLAWLHKAIVDKHCPEVKATLLDHGSVLIVRIGGTFDIFIHTLAHLDRSDDHVFALDNMRINLLGSNLERAELWLISSHPWDWWRSHTLGQLVRRIPGDGNIISRLVGKTLRGRLAEQDIASLCAATWLDDLGWDGAKLQYQSSKFAEEHGRSVLSRPLWALRAQQLLIRHGSQLEQISVLLRGAIHFDAKQQRSHFINKLFEVMRQDSSEESCLIKAAHALVESVATLALCEGWEEPFSVQLVEHGGRLCQRLCFVDEDQELTLIVGFDPETALETLKGASSEQWQLLRMLLHTLWVDGIRAKKTSDAYQTTLAKHVKPEWPGRFEQLLLEMLSSGKAPKREAWSKLPSFLSVLNIQGQNVKGLLKLARELIAKQPAEGPVLGKLCWRLIDRCIHKSAFKQAAQIVRMQLEADIPLSAQSKACFSTLLASGQGSELLPLICPWPAPDDWSSVSSCRSEHARKEALVSLLDSERIDNASFLSIYEELAVRPAHLSQQRLAYLLAKLPAHSACEQLQAAHGSHLHRGDYRSAVNALIAHSTETELPGSWIADYLLEEQGFVGPAVELQACIDRLVASQSQARKKAAVLMLHGCEDEAAWSVVSDDFLAQEGKWPEEFARQLGSDAESLSHWCAFLDCLRSDPDFALQHLEAVEGKEAPIKRGELLMRLLSSWDKGRIDARLLDKLFPFKSSKYSWAKITEGVNSVSDLHARLANSKYAPLAYSVAFLRAAPPKVPGYHKRLAKRLVEIEKKDAATLRKLLLDERYRSCLSQHPSEAGPVLELLEFDAEGIEIALEVLGNSGSCSQKLANKLLCAAAKLVEEDLELVVRCYERIHQARFAKSCHVDYRKAMLDLTCAILNQSPTHLKKHPRLIKTAIEIRDCLGSSPLASELPSSAVLQALLRSGGDAWVLDLLCTFPEKSKQIDAAVFDRLAQCLIAKDESDLATRFIQCCTVSTNSIRNCWIKTMQSPHLRWAELEQLFMRASKLELSESSIETAVFSVLGRQQRTPETLLKQFLSLLPHMSLRGAMKLWPTLERRAGVDADTLWMASCELVRRQDSEPLPLELANWLFQKPRGDRRKELIPDLPSLLPRLPQRVRAGALMSFLESEADSQNVAACLMYWEVLEEYLPDHIPEKQAFETRLPSGIDEARRVDILLRLAERGIGQRKLELLDRLSYLLLSTKLPLAQSGKHLALFPHLRAAICSSIKDLPDYSAANWLQEAWALFETEQEASADPYSKQFEKGFHELVKLLNTHAAAVAGRMLDMLEKEGCPWSIPKAVLQTLSTSMDEQDSTRVLAKLKGVQDLSWIKLATLWELAFDPMAKTLLPELITRLPHAKQDVYRLVVYIAMLYSDPSVDNASRAVSYFTQFGKLSNLSSQELSELAECLPAAPAHTEADIQLIEANPHHYTPIRLLVLGLNQLLQLDDGGSRFVLCCGELAKACGQYQAVSKRMLATWCVDGLVDAKTAIAKQSILALLITLLPAVDRNRLKMTLRIAAREFCLNMSQMSAELRKSWLAAFDSAYAPLVPKCFLTELYRGRLTTKKWPASYEAMLPKQLSIFMSDVCDSRDPVAAQLAAKLAAKPFILQLYLQDPAKLTKLVCDLGQVLLPEHPQSFEHLLEAIRSPVGFAKDPFALDPNKQLERCALMNTLLGFVPDNYFPRLMELFVDRLRSVYVGMPIETLTLTLETCYPCCETYFKSEATADQKQRVATALMRFLLAQPHSDCMSGHDLLKRYGFAKEAAAIESVESYITGRFPLQEWAPHVLRNDEEAPTGLEAEVLGWKLLWWIRAARVTIHEDRVDQPWNLLKFTAYYIVAASRMTERLSEDNPLINEIRFELSEIGDIVIKLSSTEAKQAVDWLNNFIDFISEQTWMHAPKRTSGLLHSITLMLTTDTRHISKKLQGAAESLETFIGTPAAKSVPAAAILHLIRKGGVSSCEVLQLIESAPAFMQHYYPPEHRVNPSSERVGGFVDVCQLTFAGIYASLKQLSHKELCSCLARFALMTKDLDWLGSDSSGVLLGVLDPIAQNPAALIDTEKCEAVMELVYTLAERVEMRKASDALAVYRLLALVELSAGLPPKCFALRDNLLSSRQECPMDSLVYQSIFTSFLRDKLDPSVLNTKQSVSVALAVLREISKYLDEFEQLRPDLKEHFAKWRRKVAALRKAL